MKSLYQAVARSLADQEPVIMATVVASQGSTPRKAGAKMAIFKDGTTMGSVGGGVVEAAVARAAGEFWSQGGALIKDYNLEQSGGSPTGMICGGEQRVLLALIRPGGAEQDIFRTLAGQGRETAPRYLVACLAGQGPRFAEARVGVMDGQGAVSGFSPDPAARDALQQALAEGSWPCFRQWAGGACFVEKAVSQGTVYIFGSGHVARPTLALAAKVGFETVVLDDRPDFANSTHFPESDRITVLETFDDALPNLSIDDDAYLILVTRGHAMDQNLLEQALATPAAYIGMIGSRKKIAACFGNLRKRGWQERDLDRVYTPIGLDIGSDTPEEIAVSIVAELIQVRARLAGKKFRNDKTE